MLKENSSNEDKPTEWKKSDKNSLDVLDKSIGFRPRLDISSGVSTYTKTLEYPSQLSHDLKIEINYSGETNKQKAFKINGIKNETIANEDNVVAPGTINVSKTGQFCNGDSELHLCNRQTILKSRDSTFFTRLARRMSIRRPVVRSNTTFVPSETSYSVNNTNLPPPTPASRRIRRWFSKHFAISPKSSTYSSTGNQHASSEKNISNISNSITIDPNSVPSIRRGLPSGPPNLSECSLTSDCASTAGNGICSSQTTDFTMSYPPHAMPNRQHSVTSARSIAGSQQEEMKPKSLYSALSSPTVQIETQGYPTQTAPPRYLSVSLAAFGYTGCNRKWVSAQTLELGKQQPSESLTASRHKSTSPTFVSSPISSVSGPATILQRRIARPQCLDLDKSPANKPDLQIIDNTPTEQADNKHACGQTPSRVNSDADDDSKVRLRLKRQGTSSVEDHEHWHRSSLIMLTVSQASPRSHPASSNSNAPPLASPLTPTGGRPDQSISASPSRSFPTRKLNFDDSYTDLPKVDEVSGKEDDLEVPVEADTDKKEPLANGHHIEAGLTNGHHLEAAKPLFNGFADASKKKTREEREVLDGHHFLRQVDELTKKLSAKVAQIEQDLVTPNLSEDILGQLRTTIGKVNLLLSKKFMQFRGLCNEAIAYVEAGGFPEAGESFVTLPSDLDGFWAMVLLQVDDCEAMISLVDELRANAWKSPLSPDAHKPVAAFVQTPSRGRAAKVAATPKTARKQAAQSKEASQARSQARERLRAAKREFLARQTNDNAATNANADPESTISPVSPKCQPSAESSFLVV